MSKCKVLTHPGPFNGKISYKKVSGVVGSKEAIEFLNLELSNNELEPYAEACYIQAINVLTASLQKEEN